MTHKITQPALIENIGISYACGATRRGLAKHYGVPPEAIEQAVRDFINSDNYRTRPPANVIQMPARPMLRVPLRRAA